MSGITVGPRQFNLMLPGNQLSGLNIEATLPYQVLDGGSGITFWNEEKLDLRGLNAASDKSRGINPLSIQLQESFPWSMTTTAADFLPSFVVYDIVSTVPLNQATLNQFFQYPSNAQGNSAPVGFLAPIGYDKTEFRGAKPQVLNTSQVIYGRWRQFIGAVEFRQGTDKFGTRMSQSGTFGSGEVMVSNDAYYYRVVCTNNDGNTIYAPSVNLAIWAEVISLSEGQELTQLSRMVQR